MAESLIVTPDNSVAGPRGETTASLIDEVTQFQADCKLRYHFNSRWDNVLNVAGIALSVSIVAAGAFEYSKAATILGSLVAAIVTAQRAFPFGARAQFYRVLIGQTANLITDMRAGLSVPNAVAALKTFRLDFAQQLPRGAATPDSKSNG